VPELPEGITHVLIQNLPAGIGPRSSAHFDLCLPEDVLTRLNDQQMSILFDRPDVDLRKAKFFASEELRCAAARHNLRLSYEDFSKVLARSEEERVDFLRDLSLARDLDLCFYDAIEEAADGLERHYDYVDLGAGDSLERRLRELRGWERQRQIRELRLYRLAALVSASEDPGTLADELKFLACLIVKGDAWATFMEFSRSWEASPDAKKLERYLPDAEPEQDSVGEGESPAPDDPRKLREVTRRLGGGGNNHALGAGIDKRAAERRA
jgi:hypothetical protein